MSRSSFDYDFRGAIKPCGENGPTQEPFPAGKCVGNKCMWYEVCDLDQKNPPKDPTLPLVGRSVC